MKFVWDLFRKHARVGTCTAGENGSFSPISCARGQRDSARAIVLGLRLMWVARFSRRECLERTPTLRQSVCRLRLTACMGTGSAITWSFADKEFEF